MADHNVKLNYTATGNPPPNDVHFLPDLNPIRVRPGQTINFLLGVGPPNGKFRVTFSNPHFFATADPNFHSTGRVNDGDGEVRVVTALQQKITYHCELLVDGVVAASSAENAGGDVIPDIAA
jgi:hypothetical protein